VTSLAIFAAPLAATAAMRIGELLVSIRRIAARPGAAVPEPGLFPLMALLHAGLVTLPLAEVILLDRPFRLAVAIPAGLVLVAATALRIWTLASIGRSWNVRVLPPSTVATSGPYQWIRHPNYLAVILEIAALPLLHSAWLSAIGLSAWNAAVLWRRIRTEEATLAQVPSWSAAMADKARFIPGIF
jgi:methyltransferase